jgi:hypothetical protein
VSDSPATLLAPPSPSSLEANVLDGVHPVRPPVGVVRATPSVTTSKAAFSVAAGVAASFLTQNAILGSQRGERVWVEGHQPTG